LFQDALGFVGQNPGDHDDNKYRDDNKWGLFDLLFFGELGGHRDLPFVKNWCAIWQGPVSLNTRPLT